MRAVLIFVGLALFGGMLAIALLDGCLPAKAPDVERETARAAVLTVAEAVRVVDVECARIVRATGDRELGAKCEAFHVPARAALVGAGSVVDAWGELEQRRGVTCAVVTVARDLALLAREMAGKGARALPVVSDALSLVGRLGSCSSPEGGAT